MAGKDDSSKSRVFSTALHLFAVRGYERVSMRDIAADVGIKASSIYNHFASKKAILDEIVAVFRAELERKSVNSGWDDVDSALKNKDPKEILTEIMLAPLALLDDPSLREIIRVVTRGQYFHEGIRSFLLEEMLHKPQAMLTRVLTRLIELGYLEDYPPDFLASELQAAMTANFYGLSLHTDGLWVDRSRTYDAMKMHVDFFWRAVEKRPDGGKE